MRKNVSLAVLLGILICILGIASVSVLGNSSQVPGPEKANINWRQFEGHTIKLILNRHPWQEVIEPMIPEFEALTGIKVKVDVFPEQEYYTKVRSGLEAGVLPYDIFMTSYLDVPNYMTKGYMACLDPYIDDPTLTDKQWYDWGDFFGGMRKANAWKGTVTTTPCVHTCAPIIGSSTTLIYRKDVLQKLGLSVPKTLQEVHDVAKTIKEKTPYYGITLRGGPFLFAGLLPWIWSYGGTLFDEDFNPTLTNLKTIKAVKLYVDTLKYAPPGAVSYDWDQINTALLSGAAAMFLDVNVVWPRVINPDVSAVVGKVGIAPMPSGPAGSFALLDFWSIGVNSHSTEKKAAWLFIEWATSKSTQLKAALKGIFPPRRSVANNPQLAKTFGEEFVAASSKSLETALPFKVSTEFWRWMKVVSTSVQKAILGQETVEKAMAEGQAKLEKLVTEWRASNK